MHFSNFKKCIKLIIKLKITYLYSDMYVKILYSTVDPVYIYVPLLVLKLLKSIHTQGGKRMVKFTTIYKWA